MGAIVGPDWGYQGAQGVDAPQGFGEEVGAPNWGNTDSADQFQAGQSAELAEATAARGDTKNAHDQLSKAQGYQQAITDSGLAARVQAWIDKARAFVDSKAPQAAALAQDATLNDATWVADNTASAADLQSQKQEAKDIDAAARAKAAGLDGELAYNGIPDPGGILTQLGGVAGIAKFGENAMLYFKIGAALAIVTGTVYLAWRFTR